MGLLYGNVPCACPLVAMGQSTMRVPLGYHGAKHHARAPWLPWLYDKVPNDAGRMRLRTLSTGTGIPASLSVPAPDTDAWKCKVIIKQVISFEQHGVHPPLQVFGALSAVDMTPTAASGFSKGLPALSTGFPGRPGFFLRTPFTEGGLFLRTPFTEACGGVNYHSVPPGRSNTLCC